MGRWRMFGGSRERMLSICLEFRERERDVVATGFAIYNSFRAFRSKLSIQAPALTIFNSLSACSLHC